MTTTLEATVDIDATPEQVWAVLSDLKRMPEFSPQCRRMIVLGGAPREGARTINLNRQSWKFWPTTSKIVRFEPNKALAFRTVENRTIWSYVLEATATGTKVTERRDAPTGINKASSLAVDKVLGGVPRFEVELLEGMNATLAKIKAAVERS